VTCPIRTLGRVSDSAAIDLHVTQRETHTVFGYFQPEAQYGQPFCDAANVRLCSPRTLVLECADVTVRSLSLSLSLSHSHSGQAVNHSHQFNVQ
jgi:hypothetical protein